MARPRKYASDAERQAAYRARYCVIDARIPCETRDTLDKIALAHDVPRTEVINAVINHGLLNYAWLSGAPLPGRRLESMPQRSIAHKTGLLTLNDAIAGLGIKAKPGTKKKFAVLVLPVGRKLTQITSSADPVAAVERARDILRESPDEFPGVSELILRVDPDNIGARIVVSE